MVFNWRSPILPRIALLAITAFLFGVFTQKGDALYAVIFLVVTFFQVKLLIQFMEHSNQNITMFLDNLQLDDTTYTFKIESDDPQVMHLQQQLKTQV